MALLQRSLASSKVLLSDNNSGYSGPSILILVHLTMIPLAIPNDTGITVCKIERDNNASENDLHNFFDLVFSGW